MKVPPVSKIDSSHISITNLSPSIKDLQFYLNDKSISLPGSPISFGNTVYQSYILNPTSGRTDTLIMPYININPGFNDLEFRAVGNNSNVCSVNSHFDSGAIYSLFLVDTLIHGKVASVLLKDNFAEKDSNKAQIRFLNLSPDAPPMDIWAFPNGGVNGYQLFSNCAYVPRDFNSFINAQNFTFIDKGPYFFIAAESGTSNVLLEGQLFIDANKLITIYAKGYVRGSGINTLDVGVIQYDQ